MNGNIKREVSEKAVFKDGWVVFQQVFHSTKMLLEAWM